MPRTARELKALRRSPRVRPEQGVVHFLGTEFANHEPSATFDERRGRCFELATYSVILGGAPPGSLLVHGSWHGPEAPARIGHAWVVFRDEVSGDWLAWEPVTATLYDRDEFYHWTGAWDEASYTKRQAQKLVLETGHYGRWHESRYPAYNLQES